jgi:F-type H+-transporting ATPase subunit gamma
MASLKSLKLRIGSVKSTQKITKAMKMVAAAKLRRAQSSAEAGRPYSTRLSETVNRLVSRVQVSDSSPRLIRGTGKDDTHLIVVVTSDRGLAGAFNTNIIREGIRLKREFTGEGAEVNFAVVGRRGNSTMTFRGETVTSSYVGFTDRPAFTDAREISRDVTAAYVDEELDRVELVYNRYVSPLTQYVRRQTLLPMQEAEVFGEGIPEPEEPADPDLAEAHEKAYWDYEPDPERLLPMLFEEYVDLSVYRALLESSASELGARMTAMRSAAENAQDMIGDLTLAMNRARQAEITQEILEVVGGAEALG